MGAVDHLLPETYLLRLCYMVINHSTENDYYENTILTYVGVAP